MNHYINKCFSTSLSVIFLYLLSAFVIAAETETDFLESQVQEREIAFAKTMEDRDLEAFISFISPEAIFFNGDTPIRGVDAVEEAWAPFFEDEAAPFSWQPEVIQVLESGTLAISSGAVTGPAGEAFGRFNSIWRKDEDGQWRVIFDKGS